MVIRKHLLAVLVFTLAATPFGCVAGSGTYRVAAILLQHDKAFASPTVIVKPGVPAHIKVSGRNGYRLSLTVAELGANRIKVSTELASTYGKMAPVVVVHPGQPATVSVGHLGITLTVKRNGS